jgi:hypothetical protein
MALIDVFAGGAVAVVATALKGFLDYRLESGRQQRHAVRDEHDRLLEAHAKLLATLRSFHTTALRLQEDTIWACDSVDEHCAHVGANRGPLWLAATEFETAFDRMRLIESHAECLRKLEDVRTNLYDALHATYQIPTKDGPDWKSELDRLDDSIDGMARWLGEVRFRPQAPQPA